MSSIRVGVHNGSFHADDVFAVASLKLFYRTYFPQPIEIEVVRSRRHDVALLAMCDVRVDVGGKYSDGTRDYDHHQPGGAGVRKWNDIPYAAFGLVWKHYGKRICMGNGEIAHLVDDHLVKYIDADDNGVSLSGESKRESRSYSAMDVIMALNPVWNEEPDFEMAFLRAVDVALLILERSIARNRGIVEAKPEVLKIIKSAEDPRLIIFTRAMPWKKPVIESAPEAKFVVYFSAESGNWLVQAVPVSTDSFETRLQLPEEWAGLKDGPLATITGVDDAEFCHNNRHLAGAKSKEGVLKLAQLALAS